MMYKNKKLLLLLLFDDKKNCLIMLLITQQYIFQNRHEADIIKVLESFKSTGQIMRVVLEAYVFRKQYFVGTFLKTLINSRVVDDRLRDGFIEKLNKMNKIPKHVYNKWKQEQQSNYFS